MTPLALFWLLSPARAGTLVVDLDDGTSLETAIARTGLPLRWANPRSEDESLAVAESADPDAEALRLRGLPGVEAAEASVLYEALGWPDDPLYDRQWNMPRVGAPVGWRLGGGRGVTVAVIDTGVLAVPDLQGTTLLPGFSFVPGRPDSRDDNGHGTHVAGTIAQTTHNGLGAVGLAPRVRLLPIKALAAQGGGQSEWIASAIDEAVDQGAQIINLSLGGPHSAVIEVAVRKAQARGVLVVAAAGNSGREGLSWPARLPGVVSVGATGPRDALAPYSTWGEGLVLSAPGGDKRETGGGILQQTLGEDGQGTAFRELQGTSMATPHVSGALAVLLGAGAGPRALPLLTENAVDLGEPGRDPRFGHGRLDLAAAGRALAVERGQLGLLALLATALLSPGISRGGRLGRGLVAALAAAGLPFLPLLPLPALPLVTALSTPWIHLPIGLLGPTVAHNPLWLSALLPALATLFFGPWRPAAGLIAGASAGFGVSLLGLAAAGGAVWGLPASIGGPWLVVNGLLCLLSPLLLAGLHRTRGARR